MIVDAFLDFLANIVTGALSWLPVWSLPTWWPTAMSAWAALVAGIASLAHWVPLDAVMNVAIGVALASAFAFSLTIGRIVLSIFSGGGGAK